MCDTRKLIGEPLILHLLTHHFLPCHAFLDETLHLLAFQLTFVILVRPVLLFVALIAHCLPLLLLLISYLYRTLFTSIPILLLSPHLLPEIRCRPAHLMHLVFFILVIVEGDYLHTLLPWGLRVGAHWRPTTTFAVHII